MRKFFLTLTAGIMAAGAFGPAAQAAWIYHRPVVVAAAPVIVAPPAYVAPPVVPVVYAPPVFPVLPQVVVYHHWHDWRAHRFYW
jgi:hypothetical protein